MLKRLTVLTAIAVVAVAVAYAQGGGGQNAAPKARGAVPEPAPIDRVALAGQIADYGAETGSVEALVLAAQILSQAGVREVEREKETIGAAAEEGDKPAQGPELDPEDLLEHAAELAEGDSTLEELVERHQEALADREMPRGRVEGPGVITTIVNAYSTDRYYEVFRADEYARVVVNGDGDTDLDLYIYDENGNLIDSDTDLTDYCICDWEPIWTGSFRIEVRNLGAVWNRYTLTTN